MSDILNTIYRSGIVPVVSLQDAEDARPLSKALYQAGLRCAEITFRTEAAEKSIQIIKKACPDMLIGAGTVLTPAQLDKAINAGAQFIVTPGFNPTIVKLCLEAGLPVIPGCSTPTDIEAAMGSGLNVVKFFPAEPSGGLVKIKALSAPYPGISFMPTGGINASNISQYLCFNRIIACGGSWMVNPRLIEENRFDEIERLSRECINTILDLKLERLTVYKESPYEPVSDKNKDNVCSLSDLIDTRILNNCLSDGVPALSEKDNINIEITTPNVERAVYHLKNQGYVFDPDRTVHNAEGKMISVFIKNRLHNFSVQLKQSMI